MSNNCKFDKQVIELTNSISIASVHLKLQEFKAMKLKGKRVRECSMMSQRLLLLAPSLNPCNLWCCCGGCFGDVRGSWCVHKIRIQNALNTWIELFWKLICLFNVCFSMFQGKYEQNALFVQKVHFRGFSANPKIESKSQPWLFDIELTPVIFSDVEIKACTKISKNVFESRQCCRRTTT